MRIGCFSLFLYHCKHNILCVFDYWVGKKQPIKTSLDLWDDGNLQFSDKQND